MTHKNCSNKDDQRWCEGLVLIVFVANSPCQMTIDTGSSITIVKPGVISNSNPAEVNVKRVKNSI